MPIQYNTFKNEDEAKYDICLMSYEIDFDFTIYKIVLNVDLLFIFRLLYLFLYLIFVDIY